MFRFFLNDFSTTTQGIDLISTLVKGSTSFSAAYNYTDTAVKNVESSVINRFRITTLERGLPNTRWSFTVNHDARRFNLMGRVNYFGQFWDSEDGRNAEDLGVVSESWLYPSYGGKALLDVELGIPLGESVTLAIGGENVLNTYPDVNEFGIRTVGNYYGQFSPFGFNGANIYVRLNYRWGLSRPAVHRSSRTQAAPQRDPERVREEVAEQIAELEALYDELIGHLKSIQEAQTDVWAKRWAGDQATRARMAKKARHENVAVKKFCKQSRKKRRIEAAIRQGSNCRRPSTKERPVGLRFWQACRRRVASIPDDPAWRSTFGFLICASCDPNISRLIIYRDPACGLPYPIPQPHRMPNGSYRTLISVSSQCCGVRGMSPLAWGLAPSASLFVSASACRSLRVTARHAMKPRSESASRAPTSWSTWPKRVKW